jgi:hypothetical protein
MVRVFRGRVSRGGGCRHVQCGALCICNSIGKQQTPGGRAMCGVYPHMAQKPNRRGARAMSCPSVVVWCLVCPILSSSPSRDSQALLASTQTHASKRTLLSLMSV